MDAGCIPGVRVFQGPSSVFGARCSALGVGPHSVPGIRFQVRGYPVPDTWNLVPGISAPFPHLTV